MNVITLITDRKAQDFFLGRVKGQILKSCPSAVIVDIAHGIEPFNVTKAGFILKNSFLHFPENTIHLIGVDCEEGKQQAHLIVLIQNHIFIGADNGIFNLISDLEIKKIIQIPKAVRNGKKNPALMRFIEIAKQIIDGKNISDFGEEIPEYKRKISFEPTFDNNTILGKVIYIDSYENVITNITSELFDRIGLGRKFVITIGSTRNVISSLTDCYQDIEPGNLLALFNSLGLLEIAINKGKVAELFNFDTKTSVRINFSE